MEYKPLNYEQINASAGLYSPSTQKFDCYSFAYWERALFQRACYSIMINTGDTITGKEKDFFLYCLFRFGFVAFWDDKKFGKVFNPATLGGYNFYYQPTYALVTNPALVASKKLTIGSDCELIKLTPDYYGIWDIIEFYARQLSLLDPAINVSIENNTVPFVFSARTKAGAEAIKKILDKIHSGISAVFLHEKVLSNDANNNPAIDLLDRKSAKDCYITDKQLADRQTILNQFDREIGIPTIPYAKKERLVSDEANSAIIDSQARITIWIDTLRESFRLVNEKYGTNFSVVSRYEMMEGDENGESNVNRDRELS